MTRPIRILIFVDLVQDLDVLSPVILHLRRDALFELRVVVSKWLLAASPRTAAVLTALKAPFQIVRRRAVIDGAGPSLRGVDALITASESDHAAHAAGWALTGRANTAGIATYTVQHGLRMPGLGGAAPARFASSVVLCWFAENRLPTDLSEETRGKLVHVGRLTTPSTPAVEPTFDLAIFENLHDQAYCPKQREQFLETLLGLLRVRGDLSVCVRTHPAGAWLDPHAEAIRASGGAFIASAEARASIGGARALIAQSRAVITTPSTIALDAAEDERPVGLALPGGADFEPLTNLSTIDTWLEFARTARFGPAEIAFSAKHLAPGDAWARLRARLVSRCSRASTHTQRSAPAAFLRSNC